MAHSLRTICNRDGAGGSGDCTSGRGAVATMGSSHRRPQHRSDNRRTRHQGRRNCSRPLLVTLGSLVEAITCTQRRRRALSELNCTRFATKLRLPAAKFVSKRPYRNNHQSPLFSVRRAPSQHARVPSNIPARLPSC